MVIIKKSLLKVGWLCYSSWLTLTLYIPSPSTLCTSLPLPHSILAISLPATPQRLQDHSHCEWHAHTAIFKMDNQQGHTVWNTELCSMLCGSLDGRGVWGRIDTCIWMAESLCLCYPLLHSPGMFFSQSFAWYLSPDFWSNITSSAREHLATLLSSSAITPHLLTALFFSRAVIITWPLLSSPSCACLSLVPRTATGTS